MVIFCIIKLLICRFTKNQSPISIVHFWNNCWTMRHLQREHLLRARLRTTSVMTVVYKTSNMFIMLREMLMIFRLSKLNITFSKALSFHLNSLNGTSQILSSKTLKVSVFLKTMSSNLLDPPQEVFSNATTKKE